MNFHYLTPNQCDALAAKFGAMQAELGRILKRMEKRRFPANDELQLLTREAFDKLQHLRMSAHYLGCTGVGNQVSEQMILPDDSKADELGGKAD
jgi:hypothetical protein